MAFLQLNKFIICAASAALLLACGGDYQSKSAPGNWVQRECVDWNDNARCDSDEIQSLSTASPTSTTKSESSLQALAVDSSLNTSASAVKIREEINSLTGEQRLMLIAPREESAADALTSLLWHEVAANPDMDNDVVKARAYLTQSLGINWDASADLYAQQNSTVLNRIREAQQKMNDPKLAIAALAETIHAERSLDVEADVQRISASLGALVLKSKLQHDNYTAWSYSAVRQQLALVTNENHVKIFDSKNNFSPLADKKIAAGKEAATTTASDTKVVAQVSNPMAALTAADVTVIDALASATAVAPAPAPTLPAVPTTPTSPTTPSTPVASERALSPRGIVQQIVLGSRNSEGFVVLSNEGISGADNRACNTSVNQKGIFKLNLIADADSAQAVAGCNQGNIKNIWLHQNGDNMLVWDASTRRLYWVASANMREASSYFLRLNSDIGVASLSPQEYLALVSEDRGDELYLVNPISMQIMSRIAWRGAPLRTLVWLNDGEQVLLLSNQQWQRWDVRVAQAPQKLAEGSIDATAFTGDVVTVSDNGLFYGRQRNNQLFIYRLSDNALVETLLDVTDVFWQASDLMVRTSQGFSRYQLVRDITNPLQRASIILNDVYVAADNSDLSSVKQKLNLPATLPGTSLPLIWSGNLTEITYSGVDAGEVAPVAITKSGRITATINTNFRGNAVRWQREFDITIQP